MSFVNGGVRNATTKKALREAVAADASKVEFYGTSPMGSQFNGKVSTLPDDGRVLIVAGPDPYTKRNWFANIMWKNVKGERKIVVE